MDGTEFPSISVQCPFSQGLLHIVAYSVIMMKLMLIFASTFKDLYAGHYSECFIIHIIYSPSVLTVILEVGTGGFQF